MIDLSIYILSEIKSMTKNSFYSRFPDKNAAWAMSLNEQETNQAEKITSVSWTRCYKIYTMTGSQNRITYLQYNLEKPHKDFKTAVPC